MRVRARARAKARARVRVKVRVSPNPNPGPGARDGARGRGPRGGLGARLAPPRRRRGLEKSVYHLSRALRYGGATAVFDDVPRAPQVDPRRTCVGRANRAPRGHLDALRPRRHAAGHEARRDRSCAAHGRRSAAARPFACTRRAEVSAASTPRCLHCRCCCHSVVGSSTRSRCRADGSHGWAERTG